VSQRGGVAHSGVLTPCCRPYVVVVVSSSSPSFAHIILSSCRQDDTSTYARHPPPKKGNERINMRRPPPEKGEERMRQPHRNHLNYVACSAVSILVMRYDHPRYADDAEVAPRLEPTSKCMNKFFWCVSLILSKLQAFLWGGVSLAFFFWHYFIEN